MKESTKVMFKKHGWRIDRFIHNYIYFKFYYPYVKVLYSSVVIPVKYLSWIKPLKHIGYFVFNRYHAKVLSSNDTKKFFSLNEDISAISKENKKIVPYKYAYKIILQEPDYITVMDCPCKKSAGAPDWTINSCLAVGKGLGTFWLDHCKKYNPKKINQEEALKLIKNLRKEGHVTQAFFKVATGGSTGVICNCHPDSCVSLIASSYTKKLDPNLVQSAESGYIIDHNLEKCKSCETCVKACAFSAIQFKDGVRIYDKDICMGCELCVEQCPNEALSIYVDPVNKHFYKDPNKTLPLDLDLVKEKFAGSKK